LDFSLLQILENILLVLTREYEKKSLYPLKFGKKIKKKFNPNVWFKVNILLDNGKVLDKFIIMDNN